MKIRFTQSQQCIETDCITRWQYRTVDISKGPQSPLTHSTAYKDTKQLGKTLYLEVTLYFTPQEVVILEGEEAKKMLVFLSKQSVHIDDVG